MSVAADFSKFCSNIRMSDKVTENIRYRTKRITKQLNKDFWSLDNEVVHSLYSGSYGRGTDIFTSDIDLLMQLPYETYKRFDGYEGNGQSSLLQAVKESIGKTYPTYKKGDGQVVKVDFSDGISYEVVPCFLNNDEVSFTYPDTNSGGSWKSTNPRLEIIAFNDLNKVCNGNLKRLCRMVRCWKRQHDVNISGFLIDTLAYDFLKNWEYKDKSEVFYDWMVRDFFEYLGKQDINRSYWFAPGSSQLVYRRGVFEYKAKKAFDFAVSAIESKDIGCVYTSKQEWRKIFGTKFPS